MRHTVSPVTAADSGHARHQVTRVPSRGHCEALVLRRSGCLLASTSLTARMTTAVNKVTAETVSSPQGTASMGAITPVPAISATEIAGARPMARDFRSPAAMPTRPPGTNSSVAAETKTGMSEDHTEDTLPTREQSTLPSGGRLPGPGDSRRNWPEPTGLVSTTLRAAILGAWVPDTQSSVQSSSSRLSAWRGAHRTRHPVPRPCPPAHRRPRPPPARAGRWTRSWWRPWPRPLRDRPSPAAPRRHR